MRRQGLSTAAIDEAIRAAELTADHLGRRIQLDYSNDDQTFATARIVKIRHKQIGDSDETETL